ncbi:MAG: cysteine hydrolase family protein [Candidatus Aminicenantes bacterium]|nr:cysteine hydrolase family protein [Candidatus Aminicenantes bacterium]
MIGNLILAAAIGLFSSAASQTPQAPAPTLDRPVLLIIDIQNFYFEGGEIPLVGSVKASLRAKSLLEAFRSHNLPVIHVAHMPKEKPENKDPQYDLHPNVAPRPDEPVVVKHYADAFRETDLLDRLRALGAKTVVICGMQTHMCVEAATRHAADIGFEVVLAEDACATRDLKYKETTVPAASVHAAVLAAMNGTYAKIATVAEIAAALN